MDFEKTVQNAEQYAEDKSEKNVVAKESKLQFGLKPELAQVVKYVDFVGQHLPVITASD